MGKLVDSRNIEFGYELLSSVPYAYELYLRGELDGTVSGKLSEPLYYFSPRHTINPEPRSWYNTYKAGLANRDNGAEGLPWLQIHLPDQPDKKFPPYGEHYANDTYKWKKPTLCICNRASIEWEHSMINYFDNDILDWLFKNLKKKYEIIYFPTVIPDEIQDNQKPIPTGDAEVAKKHGIKTFTQLLQGASWNEVLLKVFANCKHYITMNGGYSILASCFSGTNIVYSKPGQPEAQEIKNYEFWRWYPNINNVRTLHVPSYDKLKERVQTLYIDQLPTANVIIRTSNRPNFFRNCINSVLKQTYKNINIVVVCDDKKSLYYTHRLPVRCFMPTQPEHRPTPSKDEKYGKWFAANDYIRQAQEKVDGYVFILDDDDVYTDNRAIEKVMVVAEPDKLVMWRVRMNNMVIPHESWGKKPKLFESSSIGMCYHTSQLDKTDWSPWKRGDYRTAAGFDQVIWLDELLAKIQKQPGKGQRFDIAKSIDVQRIKKMGTINIRFRRQYKDRKAGDVESIDWVEGMYYIRREIAELVEDEQSEKEEQPVIENKQLIPAIEDKEQKPKRRRKTVKK